MQEPAARRLPIASIAIVVGGLCALVALLLPWVRAAYPAIDGDPATVFYDGPGTPLANGLHSLIAPPHVLSVELPIETLMILLLPTYLLAFGLALLLGRRWATNRAARRAGLIASILGLLLALFFAYAYVNIEGSLDVVRATRTPQAGALLACASYVIALLGAMSAPSTHTTQPRAA